MKASFTKTFFMACAAIFAMNVATAQNVFWGESFTDTGDLPAGWTTEDISGNGGTWAWCNDPSSTNPCILNWAAYSGQHEMGFFSTSGEGHIYMDSDALGAVTHEVVVTTAPIDCSNESVVWLKMESLIGVFGMDADPNAILEVSTDNTNWSQFQIFEGLDVATRWSENPQISLVDITPVAAGAATVYLRWSWIGNYEYYWLIDDLELYDADPSPIFILANDMRVNDNFYAIAPNAVTPATQVEQFGFLADIENRGFQDQTGVNLNISIVDDGSSAVVHTDDLFYGDIMADSLAENVLFPGAGFSPAAEAGKTYTGTYTVTSDSVDLDPDNNVQIFDFAVSDSSFQKEMGATRLISPAASNWDDLEAHSWAYGNCFFVTNGDGLYARTASFSLGNADDAEIGGRAIQLTLYSWVDANADFMADPDERTSLASTFYTIVGDETTDQIITVPLLDLQTQTPLDIPLANNTYYIIMLEYTTADLVDLVMMASGDYDYSAMAFRAEELLVNRYGSMLGVNGDLSSEPYSSTGFGRDLVPVVRMSIGDAPLMTPDAVTNILSDDNKITVSPNPADAFINLNLDLVAQHDEAIIRIMDVTGKVISSQSYTDVQNQTYKFNVSSYAAGTYFVNFITDEGSKTVRFVVSK